MNRYLLAIAVLPICTTYCPAHRNAQSSRNTMIPILLNTTSIPSKESVLRPVSQKTPVKYCAANTNRLRPYNTKISVRKVPKDVIKNRINQLQRYRTIWLNLHNIPLAVNISAVPLVKRGYYTVPVARAKQQALSEKDNLSSTQIKTYIAELLAETKSRLGLENACTSLKTALTWISKTPSSPTNRNHTYGHLARAIKLICKENTDTAAKRRKTSPTDLTDTMPLPSATPEPLRTYSPMPLVALPVEPNPYQFFGEGLELFGDLPPGVPGLPELGDDLCLQNIF